MATLKVSRGNDLLYETYANAEGNITSLLSAIRTVQKESNEYLSKLVQEENKNIREKHNDDKGEEDDEDSEDDADREDKSDSKQEDSGKRQNSGKSPNLKKFCSYR